jgi:hypothetical protein
MTMKTKRLSLTKLWMMSHSDDTPPPKSPNAAAAWRKKRGLDGRAVREHDKYEEAMAEQRRREFAADERGGR